MKSKKSSLLLLAFVWVINLSCHAAEDDEVPLDALAPALVGNWPTSAFQKIVDGRQGIIGVTTLPGDGAKVDGVVVSNKGVSFRVEGEGLFPLLRCPVPNPNELAKANNLVELVKLFLPEPQGDHTETQYFHDVNYLAEVNMILSKTGEPFGRSIGAMYVQEGRLIGVRCYLLYSGTEKPRDVDAKIYKLSIDMWISSDLSKR